MKIYVSRASEPYGTGVAKDYESLGDCVETLLNTENFGTFEPGVIVTKADDMTEEKCGEKCEYEVMIYDTWVE